MGGFTLFGKKFVFTYKPTEDCFCGGFHANISEKIEDFLIKNNERLNGGQFKQIFKFDDEYESEPHFGFNDNEILHYSIVAQSNPPQFKQTYNARNPNTPLPIKIYNM